MTHTANYFIRPASLNDEAFLWQMLYEAIYIPQGSAPLPREIIKEPALSKYVAGWGQPDDLGFVALDTINQQPIGAAWARLLKGELKGYGWVDDQTPELSIAILPAWRGKGVGTKLLKQLIDAAQSHYTALSLSVSPDNPARLLYARLGFEVIHSTDHSITMRKRFHG